MDKELQQSVYQRWYDTKIDNPQESLKRDYQEREQTRYKVEPEIFSFAQFSRFSGQRVLEVGIGDGTDFMQWARCGAVAYGIDTQEEVIEHVRAKLALYNLPAQEVSIARSHAIPYPDNYFDCTYAWGIKNPTHSLKKCLAEMIRVTKPGGIIKFMVHNQRSLFAFYQRLRTTLFPSRKSKSVTKFLKEHHEKLGLLTTTKKELTSILHDFPVEIITLDQRVTNYDLLHYKPRYCQAIAYALACLFGFTKRGWFITCTLSKIAHVKMI